MGCDSFAEYLLLLCLELIWGQISMHQLLPEVLWAKEQPPVVLPSYWRLERIADQLVEVSLDLLALHHLAVDIIKADDSWPFGFNLLSSSLLWDGLWPGYLGTFHTMASIQLERRHLSFLRTFILVQNHSYQYMINWLWHFGVFDRVSF
jgi:hypothetical protein